MKKFIVTAVMAIIPMFGFAQKEFDKFEDTDGIDSVIINEKMADILGAVKVKGAGEAEQYLNSVKSLESLRIFMTKDRAYAADMEKTAKAYLKKHKMDELMRVKKDGQDVKIYVTNGATASIIKEMLLYVWNPKDNEAVLVSFIGMIDLNGKENIN